jgi:hypothetical protein
MVESVSGNKVHGKLRLTLEEAPGSNFLGTNLD